MKRVVVTVLLAVVLIVAACTARNIPSVTAPTSVPATVPATGAPTATAAAAAEFETFWWRVWEREKAGEYALTCDLDMDGAAETITYETNDAQYNCTLMVNDLTYPLEAHSLNYIVLHDFDPSDACIDLLVSGDEASCDYITYLFRYDGRELTLLDTEYGILEMLGQDDTRTSVWLVQQADVLGTWGGSRAYTFQDGALIASDGTWKNTTAFDPEFCLTVTRALPVTVDGRATTLPVGTRLMPTVMAVDGSWASVQTDTGTTATLSFTSVENQWERLIDGAPESNYFDAIPYSG